MVRYAVPAVGVTAAAELSSLLASGLGPFGGLAADNRGLSPELVSDRERHANACPAGDLMKVASMPPSAQLLPFGSVSAERRVTGPVDTAGRRSTRLPRSQAS
jgi:hypothetical protein